MLALSAFYAPSRQTRAFGVWARDYTIALAPNGGGYHIGQDYHTNREPIDVPAILAGKVVRVRPAEEVLGSVVVLECGWGKGVVYVQYSHLSKDRLPSVGQWIGQGGRVGRLAAGPNGRTATRNNPAVSMSHVEWPGTGWDGIHLHLVISTHPDAGYSKVAGYRTLSAFINPLTVITSVLASAAGGGSKPFEEDDMFDDNDRKMLRDAMDAVTPGKEGVKYDGLTYRQAKEANDRAKAALDAIARIEAVVVGPIPRAGEMGGTTDLKSFIAYSDENNIVTRRQVLDAVASVVKALSKIPGVDPKTVEEAIAKGLSGTVLDPKAIAKAVRTEFKNTPLT